MKSERQSDRRSACPLSIALELFGDRWSLLVIRDLMFKGHKTFKEFSASSEGIATNILSDRLERLEAGGVILRERDPQDARKALYRLTAKGIDLAPVLIDMILWAARYEKTAAPPAMLEKMTKHRDKFIADLRKRCEGS